jgi:predicted nucleotidyltransferase
MTRVKRSEIRRVAKAVGAAFKPHKVYLFGSYTYGKPTQNSDVDLLVVMDTRLSNVEQAVQIRKAINFPFATDLIVRTPKQLAVRLNMGDDFIREIVTEGQVLYEATDG